MPRESFSDKFRFRLECSFACLASMNFTYSIKRRTAKGKSSKFNMHTVVSPEFRSRKFRSVILQFHHHLCSQKLESFIYVSRSHLLTSNTP